MNATLNMGGGVDIGLSTSYNQRDIVQVGIALGKVLLAASGPLNIPVFPNIFNVSVAPFISKTAIDEIWSAKVDTVVARNTADCGPSALDRLNITGPDDIVTLAAYEFFAPGETTNNIPIFLGNESQPNLIIPNDPLVTVTYVNSTNSAVSGTVAAETTIIFLGANVTLEGAQYTMQSPNQGSRIHFVDVLVCTSKTTLEPSHCFINQGNVTSCTAYAPTNASAPGGLNMITNPDKTALILAASPATAFYALPSRLPMYIINSTYLTSGTPPTSYLTINAGQDTTYVSQSYIIEVLFGKSAQALVQGLAQTMPHSFNQELEITAIFGTSQAPVLFVILAMCVTCALVATYSGVRSFRNHYAPLDVVRLLAFSRNPELDEAFVPYANLKKPVDADIFEKKIGYGWVKELGRHVFIVESSPGEIEPEDLELRSLIKKRSS